MNKKSQRDASLLRGALITGCSLWKPILHPVCHPTGGASSDENSNEETVEETIGHAVAEVEALEEGPAVPFDFQSV